MNTDDNISNHKFYHLYCFPFFVRPYLQCCFCEKPLGRLQLILFLYFILHFPPFLAPIFFVPPIYLYIYTYLIFVDIDRLGNPLNDFIFAFFEVAAAAHRLPDHPEIRLIERMLIVSRLRMRRCP